MILPDRSVPVPDEVLAGLLDPLVWYRCDSKVRFPSRRVARWWRRWAERRFRHRFTVVRCERCQGFHLTKGRRWQGEHAQMRHGATESDTSEGRG